MMSLLFVEAKDTRNSTEGFHPTRDNDRRLPPSNLPPRFANKHHQGHDDGRRRPASSDTFERRPPSNFDNNPVSYEADTRGHKSDRSLWKPSEKEQRNNHHNQFDHQGARDGSARAPQGTRTPGSAGQGSMRCSQMENNARPNHQEQQRSCIGGDINVNAKSYGRMRGPGGVPTDHGRYQQQAAVQSMLASQCDRGQRSDTRSLPGRRDVIEEKMAGLSMAATSGQGFEPGLQNVVAPMSYSMPPVVTNVNYSCAGAPQDGFKQVC